jgi:glycosyltransferase involved in cell wall biosynthesis
MMRLLVLAPSPPHPTMGGGALRMYHLVRFLAQRLEVDLVAPALEGTEETARLMRRYCREVVLVPPSPRGAWRRHLRLGPYERDPALARTIQERLANHAYAAVHVEKPAMLPYVSGTVDIPIVLDTFAYGLTGAVRALRHERGVLTRARNLVRLARFAAFDAWCWPETYCILVVSEPDRQRCERARPQRKVLLVPNGVDCAAYRPGPVRSEAAPLLVFTGDMAFDPNVQAAHLLATRVFPPIRREFPDAELRIVGRNPVPAVRALHGSGVVVTGEVPDVVPHLQAATVYVAPLTTGAGTRTKLLEALAVGLPVVTTRVGLEGIEAADGREVVLADDPAATVRAVCGLLTDPAVRRRLGGAARRLAEKTYDWSRCLTPLEELYAGLLPSRSS